VAPGVAEWSLDGSQGRYGCLAHPSVGLPTNLGAEPQVGAPGNSERQHDDTDDRPHEDTGQPRLGGPSTS